MEGKSYFLYYLVLTDKFSDSSAWDNDARQILEEHGEFLTNLGEQGKLIFAGRTDYNPGDESLFGIALIMASSIEEAREMMAGDPAVQFGIQQSVIHPFRLPIDFMKNQ